MNMYNGAGVSRTRTVGLVGACLLAAGISTIACSSSSRDSFVEPAPEAGPGGGGFDTTLDAGEPEDGGRCISESVTGEPVPLALIILLDRSGSMTEEKWSSATNAIRSFVDRSEVVGMQVGLQFFPPVAGAECDPNTYANLSVPMGPLPDNVLPIQQRLVNTSPTGGTPMGAALEGGILGMRTWLKDAGPHAGAVILVTDGDPAGCGGGIDAVASIAASGAKPTNKEAVVRTFAVGMQGATFSNLNKVALAGGGAPTAFNVGSGPTAQQALLDALETIRTSAISCEYLLPTPPPEKGILDPDSVEINFTPGENDPTVTVRRVPNAEACGATTGGFYYDDPKNPTRIVLCPATCDDVRGVPVEAKPKLEVLLGCIQRPN